MRRTFGGSDSAVKREYSIERSSFLDIICQINRAYLNDDVNAINKRISLNSLAFDSLIDRLLYFLERFEQGYVHCNDKQKRTYNALLRNRSKIESCKKLSAAVKAGRLQMKKSLENGLPERLYF